MYNARPVRCGALKRELASRLMNFNEVVSSRDRCKGCPESGFIPVVKQPLTKLLVVSFHGRDYDLTRESDDLREMLRANNTRTSITFSRAVNVMQITQEAAFIILITLIKTDTRKF